MKHRVPLLISVLVAAGAGGVSAQTATTAVSIDVVPVLVINAAGSFTFPAAADADYTTGYIESTAGPTLSHRANVPYKITIEAQSGATFNFVNYTGRTDPDPGKPVSDLTMLTTIAATNYSATVGAAGAGNDFYTRATRGGTESSALTARMALDYANDPPGTYSTTVVFTLVAQ